MLWYKSCNWDPWNDLVAHSLRNTGITLTVNSRDSTSTCLVCRWDGVPLGGQTQCVKVEARNILEGGRQGPRREWRPLSLTPHYLAYCISEYVRCADTSARQGQRWLIMCPEVERDSRPRVERARKSTQCWGSRLEFVVRRFMSYKISDTWSSGFHTT